MSFNFACLAASQPTSVPDSMNITEVYTETAAGLQTALRKQAVFVVLKQRSAKHLLAFEQYTPAFLFPE